jgi:soluble lytic murein transglycosylase-like protein
MLLVPNQTVATTYEVQEEKIIEEKVLTLEERIAQVFVEDPETAIAVAKAESQLKPHAYNPEWHRGCQGSIGLMQIACLHHKENPEALYDVDFNLKKAHEIYRKQGWKPWGVCYSKVKCW